MISTMRQKLVLAALLGLSAGYASFQLAESPPTWFDEGIYIQVADSLFAVGAYAVPVAPGVYEGAGHVTGGYPFLLPVGFSRVLFGDTLFAARVPMALFILLAVAATYYYMRTISKRDALLATVVVATFPLLYGNGKNVLGEVPGMVYTLGALYFLSQVESTGFAKSRYYILAGAMVGFAAATKPVFFLLPVAVGIVLLFSIRSIPFNWRSIICGALAALLPVALWALLQFGAGATPGGVVGHYANPYAQVDVLSTIQANIARFASESTPLMLAGLIAVWVAAVAMRLYRRVSITRTEWVALTFSLLIIMSYLRTAGWYRYFFEALLLSLIFFPHSLRVIAEVLPYSLLRKYVWVPVAALVLLFFYQLNVTSWVAEHYGSTKDAELRAFIGTLPADESLFVYNAPEVVPYLKSPFYQYFDMDPTGATGYGSASLQVLREGVPQWVITTPTMLEQRSDLFIGYRQSAAPAGFVLLERH